MIVVIQTHILEQKVFSTEREFNELKINDYTVIKSGNNSDKILAELNWFNKIPKELKVHTFCDRLWLL